MTGARKGRGPFLLAVCVWLIGGLLFAGAVHLFFSVPVRALAGGRDVPTRAELAEHYASADRPDATLPAATVERALQDDRARLDAALARARRLTEFTPGPDFAVGRDPADAARFSGVRGATVARLRKLADGVGVALPEALPPGPDAPQAGMEVAELLFRLAMTDRLIRSAAAAEVAAVHSVAHRPAATANGLFLERQVDVEVSGELAGIVAFVERCTSPPRGRWPMRQGDAGALVLRSVEFSGTEGAAVRARIAFSAVIALEPRSGPRQSETETDF